MGNKMLLELSRLIFPDPKGGSWYGPIAGISSDSNWCDRRIKRVPLVKSFSHSKWRKLVTKSGNDFCKVFSSSVFNRNCQNLVDSFRNHRNQLVNPLSETYCYFQPFLLQDKAAMFAGCINQHISLVAPESLLIRYGLISVCLKNIVSTLW